MMLRTICQTRDGSDNVLSGELGGLRAPPFFNRSDFMG
jgi:hypothetical protein